MNTSYIILHRQMVQLIPASVNADSTRSEIDAYILSEQSSNAGVETLRGIVREITCKSGAGVN
jgi:hypothetical protein